MKKIFALMLALLMVMFMAVGCLTSDDDDKDDDGGTNTGGGTLQATTYFPLKVGATWLYSETGTSYGETSEYTYQHVVTGTTTINGKTYFIMDEDDEDTFYRIADNKLYVLGFFDEMYKTANMPEAAKAAVAKIAEDGEEYVLVDFTKKANTPWTIYSETDSGEGYTSTMIMTGKYLGTQNVSVTAGSFNNCAKFEMVMTSTWSHSYDGQSYSGTWKSTTTVWAAPNVGIVKLTEKSEENHMGTNEVMENLTTVLTSYSIP